MISKNRKILRDYLIGWFIAMLVWELLRNIDQALDTAIPLSTGYKLFMFSVTWLAQGLCYGLLHIFIDRYLTNRIAFNRLISSALILQLIVAIGIVILFFYIMQPLNISNFPATLALFFKNPAIPIALIYAILVNFGIGLMIQVNMMLGGGNLLKIIKGQFYTPKETEKIFMFIDLKGSTTIAEQLGHIKYSQLIQDCFYDLAIVHNYGANIYQYVGDEAVLTWPTDSNKSSNNCVEAFFAFQKRLNKRAPYYQKNYNILPEFKAGANMGIITMAEVGELKREIAYHGDTINTAARLQSECNKLGAELLVSEHLLEQLTLEPNIITESKGQIQLRGKQGAINIFAINANRNNNN